MTDSEKLKTRTKLVEEHMRVENGHDIAAVIATLGKAPKYEVNGMIVEGHEAIRDLYESLGFGDASRWPGHHCGCRHPYRRGRTYTRRVFGGV